MKSFNLEEHLKNPSRKVMTRDGRNVTIHCTNLDGIFPVVGEIEGWGKSLSYNEYGENSYTESSICDLFFAPEKHEGYINIYRDTTGVSSGAVLYDSREDAEKVGKSDGYYVVTAKVEWEE